MTSEVREQKDPKEQKNFHVFIANKVWYGKHKDDRCSTCLETIQTDEFVMQLRCKHYYHLKCSTIQSQNSHCSNECYCKKARHPTIRKETLDVMDFNREAKEYDEDVNQFALCLKALYRVKEGVPKKRKKLSEEREELQNKLKRVRSELETLSTDFLTSILETPNRSTSITNNRISDVFPFLPSEDEDETSPRIHVSNDRYDRQQRAAYHP